MINVNQQFEEYCEGCSYMNISTSVLHSPKGPEAIYVQCEHRELCNRLNNRLKEENNES